MCTVNERHAGPVDVYKRQGVCILFLLATFRVSVEAIAYGMLITNVVTQILDAQLNKKLIGYGYLEQMRDILPTLLLAAGAGLCKMCIRDRSCPCGCHSG